MSKVTQHPASAERHVVAGQWIDGEGYDRLWRAQQAVSLLAAFNQVTSLAASGVNHDATAAVAEYIRDDLLEILNDSQPADAP